MPRWTKAVTHRWELHSGGSRATDALLSTRAPTWEEELVLA